MLPMRRQARATTPRVMKRGLLLLVASPVASPVAGISGISEDVSEVSGVCSSAEPLVALSSEEAA